MRIFDVWTYIKINLSRICAPLNLAPGWQNINWIPTLIICVTNWDLERGQRCRLRTWKSLGSRITYLGMAHLYATAVYGAFIPGGDGEHSFRPLFRHKKEINATSLTGLSVCLSGRDLSCYICIRIWLSDAVGDCCVYIVMSGAMPSRSVFCP